MAESSPTGTEVKGTRSRGREDARALSSSSRGLSEELQCSVCLDVFTDPVSTPCGHNFCKTCLNQCWDVSQTCSCPNCKETFSRRPDLKINTALREIAHRYTKSSPEQKHGVVCDFCEDGELAALKSCLVCQSSYCQTHLEPHLKVTGLKRHKLMDPVRNLQDYICQKHERPLELFCRDDQTCVCSFCTEKDHENHDTVPLEEESRERKAELMKTQRNVQMMVQDRIQKIRDIRHSAGVRRRDAERQRASRAELFCDLIRSIERCEAELLEVTEEQQRAAEEQDEELMEELELEITELKRRNTELEELSHTQDHLHLLQVHSSLISPTDSRSCSEISVKTEGPDALRTALTRLRQTLEEKLTLTVSPELKWMQKFAVDVTLDPDTAHPHLILSDDGKQVRHGDVRQNLPDKPQRFDETVCVLGTQGFSSGSFYFEVQVKGKTEWTVGVAAESIRRTGALALTPGDGFWTVVLRNGNEYKACARPAVRLSLRAKPERVAVFVDVDEGLVSFYDVESGSQIYCFTGQTFTHKLHPYLNPCTNDGGENSRPLIITAVSNRGMY